MKTIYIKSILVVLLLSGALASRSQIISTVAGNGFGDPHSGGFSGDGGQATSAELYEPDGLSFDSFGNVYIADTYNNRVRKVTTSTGIGDIFPESNEINVYPIPTTGSFTVSGLTQGQVIELYDYLGQKVETRHDLSLQTTLQFDISDKPNGIYLIKIQNKDGSVVAQKKIVKTE